MSRLTIQSDLEGIAENVYYQPTSNITLKYPCIVYELTQDYILYADGVPYIRNKEYRVTVISTKPDDPINIDLIDNLSYLDMTRQFIEDRLYHTVYTLYDARGSKEDKQ